ncbi:MAG: hypothetical protein WCT77_13840, partial [Bacteroidota bacterium]
IPDSLDYLTETEIESATLYLPIQRYALGDSGNPNALSFNIYKTGKAWTNLTTWDSLFAGGSSTSDYFDYNIVRGSFNGSIIQGDTMPEIKIPFDKKLIVEWFQEEAALKQCTTKVDSAKHIIWGVSLIPDNSSTVLRTISALTAEGARPHSFILVYYKTKTGSRDSVMITSAIDATVVNATSLPPADRIVVQGGVSLRSLMTFNLSSLPNLAAVHSIVLELTKDTDNSYSANYGLDSTLYMVLKSDTGSAALLKGSYYGYRNYSNKAKWIFNDITSAGEYWTRYQKKGYLELMAEGLDNEYRQLDRLVFYGMNDPDINNRPKIKIIYSTRPNRNCNK